MIYHLNVFKNWNLPSATQRWLSPQPVIKNVIVKINKRHLKEFEESKITHFSPKRSFILRKNNWEIDRIPNIKNRLLNLLKILINQCAYFIVRADHLYRRYQGIKNKAMISPFDSEDYVTPQNKR